MLSRETLLRTPLAPVAVLATLGIIADRTALVPLAIWCGGLAVGLAFLLFSRFTWLGLGLAITAAAGGHHHLAQYVVPPDDISLVLEATPRLGRLAGRLVEEPTFDPPAIGDPLRSIPELARTRAVVAASRLNDAAVSGRVSLTLDGPRPNLRAGDSIEVTGWIRLPRRPENPGERDWAAAAWDRGVRGVMHVRRLGAEAVAHPRSGDPDWLATVRAWSRQRLDAALPAPEAAIAAALLLGDGAALTRADWERYIRTGVVHVLAVSGQHLAILAAFAWVVCRTVGVRRRPAAAVIALGLCVYAALAGGRPPVLRAAVMVVAGCAALFLRRPARPANSFALAWVAVLLLNPADVFDPGFQFSFVCVALLIWLIGPWLARRDDDPLVAVIRASRPAWQRGLLAVGRMIGDAYIVTLVLGLAVMPLTAARYHLVAPVGLVIGPPAIALASVALVAGFLLLSLDLIIPAATGPLALLTRWSIAGLDGLVSAADRVPGGHVYTGDVPMWWLVGFYLLIASLLLTQWRVRHRVAAVAAWSVIGLVAVSLPRHLDGLRLTLLAVGHGGATVIETPDGRVILVDCGSQAGPEVTRRIIAPFLWHRGIRRIDELFVTHADLDHFNGLPALLERLPIGRVSFNPSFASKPTPGVRETLRSLERAEVPTRVVQAGSEFEAGDVAIDVLHPPATGPAGPENARSLVMRFRHRGRTMVLTGDLDQEGRLQLLQRPPMSIDVWLAPHHAGRTANPAELVAWARPLVALAHNGVAEGEAASRQYQDIGSAFLGTWPHGAIVVESRADGLWLHSFHDPTPRKLRD